MSHDDDHSTTCSGGPEGGGATIAMGTAFELLAAPRRRFALYVLTEASPPVVQFAALVDGVAEREAATGGDGDRDAIARDLRHWHLPVLADVGVAEYDERGGTVRYYGDGTLERWVDRARRDELG